MTRQHTAAITTYPTLPWPDTADQKQFMRAGDQWPRHRARARRTRRRRPNKERYR